MLYRMGPPCCCDMLEGVLQVVPPGCEVCGSIIVLYTGDALSRREAGNTVGRPTYTTPLRTRRHYYSAATGQVRNYRVTIVVPIVSYRCTLGSKLRSK